MSVLDQIIEETNLIYETLGRWPTGVILGRQTLAALADQMEYAKKTPSAEPDRTKLLSVYGLEIRQSLRDEALLVLP